jgi:lipopolysaccharide/colanic/teichoic acid biosynthesis glycosyltransferase
MRRDAYKRPFDLTILVLAHLVLLPLWVVLWTAIPALIFLQDRGPVFYSQTRIGKDRRVFTVVKFRSMVPDAEKLTGPVWAGADDPRITRVGKWLRATALDELPQVLSMFKGDMSLVGPRAERPELHEQFAREIDGFDDRLQVRPGLTGLAQVKGAYDLPPAEKLEYDREYIRRMSPWLDAWLLFRSVLNTLASRWDKPEGDAS